MMKQMISLCLTVFVLLAVVGCSNVKDSNSSITSNDSTQSTNLDKPNVYAIRQDRNLTFNEALEESDCTVIGKFVSYELKSDCAEYVFEVTEVLRGEVEDNIIHVFSPVGIAEVQEINQTYEIGQDIYKTNDEYILVMVKNDSLFYEYTHYGFYTEIYIPLTDISQSTIQGKPIQDIKDLNLSDVKALIKAVESSDENNSQEIKYTTETEMSNIIRETDSIFEIRVVELMFESEVANSNTYGCEVLNVLKGDCNESEEDGHIMITLEKKSVKVNEKYVVLVNQVGEDSIIYTQSSLKSVVPISDTDTISEIKRIISE